MTANRCPSAYAIPFSFPGVPGVRCLFATAGAGDTALSGKATSAAAAAENRRRFMQEAGFANWAEVHQVHGDDIIPASRTDSLSEGGANQADGHYTFEKQLGLIIKTADCQPVLFCRRDGGAIAGLHVGWRGNARNLPGQAVATLCREFACAPADLLAVRGPSLGPAAAEFVNFRAEWPEEFLPWFDPETKTVDLWALTRRQLEEAGLRGDRIFGLDLCTRDTPGWFFSHRRGEAERQVSVIWRE